MALDWITREDDLSATATRDLLALHAEQMLANSPAGACHFLDLAGLADPAVTVWTTWERDRRGAESLVGCAALREIDAGHGEVKSMRTHPDHLGRGAGRTMLAHLVDTARRRGYRRVSLETGRGDAFAAAVGLYVAFGFAECGPFDEYGPSDFSRFFTVELAPGPPNWAPWPDGHEPTEFQRAVVDAVGALTHGDLVTYGEVADEIGRPGSGQAVANVLRHAPDLPWWRVLPSSGRVYRTHLATQRPLLHAEGHRVDAERHVRPG